ncbi:MAG TPA: DUF1003 domain-containing protein [Longimicrobiaceae bacterium]|jgi:uncharacterized membrane protein
MDPLPAEPQLPAGSDVPDRRMRRDMADRHMEAVKARYNASRTPVERAADALTAVAGSTPFLVLHAAWFAVWIAWNVGAFGLRPFDPFPFGLLTMVVSLEAIFLSIFVLITQGRESEIAELREEVTLAVQLSTEAETTKILQLVLGLYSRLGFPIGRDEELGRLLEPLDQAQLERELREQIHGAGKRHVQRGSPRPGEERHGPP